MDTLRLLVTILGGLSGLLGVALTLVARRRVEEQQDGHDREATIRALVLAMRRAGPAVRRLRALEAMSRLISWL